MAVGLGFLLTGVGCGGGVGITVEDVGAQAAVLSDSKLAACTCVRVLVEVFRRQED